MFTRNCARCGKVLTDEASKANGIGPRCRGYDNSALARLMPANLDEFELSLPYVQLWERPESMTQDNGEAVWEGLTSSLLSPKMFTTLDHRPVMKRIEAALSFGMPHNIRKDMVHVASALGYIALVALWDKAVVKGEATAIFLEDPKCIRVTSPRPGRLAKQKLVSLGARLEDQGREATFYSDSPANLSALLRSVYMNITSFDPLIGTIPLDPPPRINPNGKMMRRVEGDRLHLKARYNAKFVSRLKEAVPYACRKWDGGSREWQIMVPYHDEALAIAEEIYG